MFILKTGHQPGVYMPLRALFLVFHEGHYKNMKSNIKLKLNSCCLNMCSQANMLCIV